VISRCFANHDIEPQLFRPAETHDAESISEFYSSYIPNTTVTFLRLTIDELEVRRRILDKLATHDWLVVEVSGADGWLPTIVSFDHPPVRFWLYASGYEEAPVRFLGW
jgi:L-amino acid N-acyltransferase YncA